MCKSVHKRKNTAHKPQNTLCSLSFKCWTLNVHKKLKALTLPKAPKAVCAEVSYQGRVHLSTEMPESRVPEVFNNEHIVGCSTMFWSLPLSISVSAKCQSGCSQMGLFLDAHLRINK